MNIRYRVELNEGERAQLTAMLSGGKHAARKLKRAQILLAADAGIGDEVIADSVSVGGSTVYRTKRRFVEGNLDLALSEEARPGAARKLSGKRRRCWWRRSARTRRKVASAGHSTCWRARWLD
jgi:transposase